MPVYKVKSPNGERLVKAGTKSTAINHVIRDQVTAEPLTADEVADAAAAGVKIEVAVQEPAKESAAASAPADA